MQLYYIICIYIYIYNITALYNIIHNFLHRHISVQLYNRFIILSPSATDWGGHEFPEISLLAN